MSTPPRSHLVGTVLAAVLLAISQTATAQPAGRRTLFEPGSAPSADAPGERPGHIPPRRRRVATLRLQALADEGGAGPGALLFNLFDDVQLTAQRTTARRGGDGALLWHGRIENGGGEVTVTARGSAMAATVFAAGRVFEIASTEGLSHEVRELDPAAFPTDDPPLSGGQDTNVDADEPGPVAPSDSGDVIDVLVVYTPAARQAAGGTNGILNLIDLSVANANTAYSNSQVPTELRLVGTAEVSYTETNDMMTDLSRLRSTSDGYLDTVHTLRDQYKADLVSLIGTGYSGACGIGYLLGPPNTATPDWAFNVVRDSCAAGNLSFAHEIGHNQGLHHDPPNADSSASYSYAYGYQDPGGAFRTVMSYGSSTRVMHLSNPSVTYQGRATGVANAQDNARALSNTAGIVASFRESGGSACTFAVSPTSLSYGPGGGSMTLSVSTTSGCAWTASSPVSWVSLSRTSGTGSRSVSVTVPENSGGQRSATLTVAGRAVSLSQAALTCSYSVSPTALTFASGGNTTSVSVSTSPGCTWTASSGAGWITLGSSGGSGSGSVAATAAANAGTSRSTSLTIAGRTVSVSQAAAPCTFTVSPTSLSFDSTGGSRTIGVSTGSACTWTVTTAASWLTVSRSVGVGSTSVVVTASGNLSGQRSALITVAGTGVAVTQDAISPPAAPSNLRLITR
jgi:peptidyl-Asp metalloendopeptidase